MRREVEIISKLHRDQRSGGRDQKNNHLTRGGQGDFEVGGLDNGRDRRNEGAWERGGICTHKKKRHELLAVRAGRPVTQTTPGLEECVFHLHNRNKYTIA